MIFLLTLDSLSLPKREEEEEKRKPPRLTSRSLPFPFPEVFLLLLLVELFSLSPTSVKQMLGMQTFETSQKDCKDNTHTLVHCVEEKRRMGVGAETERERERERLVPATESNDIVSVCTLVWIQLNDDEDDGDGGDLLRLLFLDDEERERGKRSSRLLCRIR
jgi:hypothetical protein